jgi:hypothetical protein
MEKFYTELFAKRWNVEVAKLANWSGFQAQLREELSLPYRDNDNADVFMFDELDYWYENNKGGV